MRNSDTTAFEKRRTHDWQSETPELPLDVHGVSLMGRRRAMNQDDYLLAPLAASAAEGPTLLLAVADGIGGGPAGERASALAVQNLHEFVKKMVAEPDVVKAVDPGEILSRGVLRCNDEILAAAESHPELYGMGTTLTAALLRWPKAWIVNAGDSRAYALRDGKLERLTRDHTMVERLLASGVLTPESARQSRWRHALWNHLGRRSGAVEPEVSSAELKAGDALLLVTDGVTDLIPDEELEALLAEPGSARGLARRILWATDEKGGKDDRSIVIARFAPRPDTPADDE